MSEKQREISIKLDHSDKAEKHFKKYGFIIVKHLSYYVVLTHGDRDGNMQNLAHAQAAAKKQGIDIRGYFCCFPVACKKKHPELNILGGYDSVCFFAVEPWGIRIFL